MQSASQKHPRETKEDFSAQCRIEAVQNAKKIVAPKKRWEYKWLNMVLLWMGTTMMAAGVYALVQNPYAFTTAWQYSAGCSLVGVGFLLWLATTIALFKGRNSHNRPDETDLVSMFCFAPTVGIGALATLLLFPDNVYAFGLSGVLGMFIIIAAGYSGIELCGSGQMSRGFEKIPDSPISEATSWEASPSKALEITPKYIEELLKTAKVNRPKKEEHKTSPKDVKFVRIGKTPEQREANAKALEKIQPQLGDAQKNEIVILAIRNLTRILREIDKVRHKDAASTLTLKEWFGRDLNSLLKMLEKFGDQRIQSRIQEIFPVLSPAAAAGAFNRPASSSSSAPHASASSSSIAAIRR